MAEIRSQDKRDKLRLIWQAVQTAGQTAPGSPAGVSQPLTLQTALLNALALCDAAINGPTPGTFLSSSSESGGSSSFQMLHDYSPVVARRLVGELCDCYDKAVERILWQSCGCQSGIPWRQWTPPNPPPPPPDDATIYAEMLRLLRSIRKFKTDYTGIRYGIGYFLNT